MTTKQITAPQAAASQGEWTPDQWGAFAFGIVWTNAWQAGVADGMADRSPYGDLSGPFLGGLLVKLDVIGPGRPRTNAAYRAMLAESYRDGLRHGREMIATEWCECDDEALNELAELGYDDEATS